MTNSTIDPISYNAGIEAADSVIQFRKPTPAELKAHGVNRLADNEQALLVSFSRRLSDDELAFFREVIDRTCPLMDENNV